MKIRWVNYSGQETWLITLNYITISWTTSNSNNQVPSLKELFIIVAKISQNCSRSAFLFVKIYRKVSSIRLFKRLIGKEAQQIFSRRTKWQNGSPSPKGWTSYRNAVNDRTQTAHAVPILLTEHPIRRRVSSFSYEEMKVNAVFRASYEEARNDRATWKEDRGGLSDKQISIARYPGTRGST